MNFNVNRKAFALLMLVFALGIGLGVVGAVVVNQRVYSARVQPRPQGPPPGPRNQQAGIQHAVDRMAQEVDLTPDQKTQIFSIIQDTQTRYDAIRQQMDPLFDKARDDGRNRIRQILTPDQVVKFNDFMTRVDEQRARRGIPGPGRGPGGPGGPGAAAAPGTNAAPAH